MPADITGICASNSFRCIAAEVYVWGRGEYGRLGLGDKGGSSRLRPCKVKAIEDHRVVQVCIFNPHHPFGQTTTQSVLMTCQMWQSELDEHIDTASRTEP